MKMLETLLANGTLKVTSPDTVVDIDTGDNREVDVSLRELETGNLVAVMECRDRSRAQDVMWLEELHGRRRSFGVGKIMAVSRKGFTRAAQIKAEKLGVPLRTFATVSQEIDAWFPSASLGYAKMEATAKRWLFRTARPVPPNEPAVRVSFTEHDPVLCLGDTTPFAPRALFDECRPRILEQIAQRFPVDIVKPPPELRGVPCHGETDVVPFVLHLSMPQLHVLHGGEKVPVTRIDVLMEAKAYYSTLKVGEGTQYESADDHAPHALRFPLSHTYPGWANDVELVVLPADAKYIVAGTSESGEVSIVAGPLPVPNWNKTT